MPLERCRGEQRPDGNERRTARLRPAGEPSRPRAAKASSSGEQQPSEMAHPPVNVNPPVAARRAARALMAKVLSRDMLPGTALSRGDSHAARRGVTVGRSSRRFYAVQREKGIGPHRPPRELQRHRRGARSREGARRRGGAVPFVDRVERRITSPDRDRDARADRLREGAQASSSSNEDEGFAVVHVLWADPFDTAGARRHPRPLRQAGGGRRVAPQREDRSTPSTASTSARPAAASSSRRATTSTTRTRRRHSRLRRRSPGHPLGQLALPPGDEGTRFSDIHIEPEEKEVVVRYRIDGELYIARRAPRAFMSSIVSRIKIESALNIAEKRLPQDGRITKKIAGKGFDIRVSTIPTSAATSASSCVSSTSRASCSTCRTSASAARDYALMDSLIHRPDGIILVTGPTGSGKTTTLYACVNRINQPNINILTAEDPVEYELGQIHQVHVRRRSVSPSPARSAPSSVRTRTSSWSARSATRRRSTSRSTHASLTGHLVLSTIHTNDAAGAVTRMVDMGVEPFLLRSAGHRRARAAPRAHALPGTARSRTRRSPIEHRRARCHGRAAHRDAHAQARAHPEHALLPAQRRVEVDQDVMTDDRRRDVTHLLQAQGLRQVRADRVQRSTRYLRAFDDGRRRRPDGAPQGRRRAGDQAGGDGSKAWTALRDDGARKVLKLGSPAWKRSSARRKTTSKPKPDRAVVSAPAT